MNSAEYEKRWSEYYIRDATVSGIAPELLVDYINHLLEFSGLKKLSTEEIIKISEKYRGS